MAFEDNRTPLCGYTTTILELNMYHDASHLGYHVTTMSSSVHGEKSPTKPYAYGVILPSSNGNPKLLYELIVFVYVLVYPKLSLKDYNIPIHYYAAGRAITDVINEQKFSGTRLYLHSLFPL